MKDIKAGDEVIVVRASRCCNAAGSIGTTFVVQEVEYSETVTCSRCGKVRPLVVAVKDRKERLGFDLERVEKKLPDSEVLEDTVSISRHVKIEV